MKRKAADFWIWRLLEGSAPSAWKVEDGLLRNDTAQPVGQHKTFANLRTEREFEDFNLRVEFRVPTNGNSGIYLQGRYEVQVLDSYNNQTYFHGQAGGIYKQYAPLVNASRKPGEWQTYDIIFHAPRFDEEGNLAKAATFTVLHNGVLVQDHVQVLGTTDHAATPKYTAHPLKQPLRLQDHGNPVHYRNIWIRPLNEKQFVERQAHVQAVQATPTPAKK
jgi:hypothetical protein